MITTYQCDSIWISDLLIDKWTHIIKQKVKMDAFFTGGGCPLQEPISLDKGSCLHIEITDYNSLLLMLIEVKRFQHYKIPCLQNHPGRDNWFLECLHPPVTKLLSNSLFIVILL